MNMEKVSAWIAATRESLKTWSGWLDLAAAALGGLLALDPTAALVVTEILPEAVRPFYTIAVVLVFFILPKFVRKKDAEAANVGDA